MVMTAIATDGGGPADRVVGRSGLAVAVTVDNSGLPSQGVQLSVIDKNGDSITSRSVRLPEMGLRADYELTVVPAVEGVDDELVRRHVSALANEGAGCTADR